VKAWQVHRHGEPEQAMRLVELPDPVPGPGQVLVRVLGVALNFPDVLLCRGTYQERPPLPFTAGVELCGEVLATGPATTAPAATGQRVIGTLALPAGALAELAVLPVELAFPAPSTLDDAQAAAFHIGYQTAWFALHRRARLAPGETLLVHAGAGGGGSAAIQLGRAAGARVVAVVGGPGKVAVARDLGADLVVDRQGGDFVAAVQEFTGGRGADVVFDPVGGDAFAGSTRCVAFEGRIVLVGFASGTVPAPALNHPLIKNYSLVGLHWGRYRQREPGAVRQAHAALTDLAGAGLAVPLVSARLPLAAAAAGLTELAAGTTVGRLVVVP